MFNKFIFRYIIIFLPILLFISCQQKRDFEVVNFSIEYQYKRSHTIEMGLIERVMSSYGDFKSSKPEIVYDARLLSLKLNIKNLTDENIEEAKLKGTIKFEFKNGATRYIYIDETHFFGNEFSRETWKPFQEKNALYNVLLNRLDGYDPNIFLHKPKKIELIVYFRGKNSVGYNSWFKELIIIDITDKF
jgi:hypothetical protein